MSYNRKDFPTWEDKYPDRRAPRQSLLGIIPTRGDRVWVILSPLTLYLPRRITAIWQEDGKLTGRGVPINAEILGAYKDKLQCLRSYEGFLNRQYALTLLHWDRKIRTASEALKKLGQEKSKDVRAHLKVVRRLQQLKKG